MAPMVHGRRYMMSDDSDEDVLFSADAFGTFGALNGRLFRRRGDGFFAEKLDEGGAITPTSSAKYGAQVQAVLKKGRRAGDKPCLPAARLLYGATSAASEKIPAVEQLTPPRRKSVLWLTPPYTAHGERREHPRREAGRRRGCGCTTPQSRPQATSLRRLPVQPPLFFAATTYNAGIFVTMENLLHDIANHNLQNRRIAVMENGSWAPTSGKQMRDILSALKGCSFIGDNITPLLPREDQLLPYSADRALSDAIGRRG